MIGGYVPIPIPFENCIISTPRLRDAGPGSVLQVRSFKGLSLEKVDVDGENPATPGMYKPF